MVQYSVRHTTWHLLFVVIAIICQASRTNSEKEDDEPLTPYTIQQQITQIKVKFPLVEMTVQTLEQTAEYNKILLIKATQKRTEKETIIKFRNGDDKFEDEVAEKKVIFIVHGLSVMGFKRMNCFVKPKQFVQLLKYYFEHLEHFDIFLIPMANPDGISVASVLWNKNSSPQAACPGVALDRNFDVAWNVTKQIGSCSQHYPGATPFSEPETRAVREVLHKNSHRIIAYVHVHAGTYHEQVFKGDAVLYPKGYTEEQSDDDKYVDLRGEIDEAVKNASFQVISVAVQPISKWYGVVYGTSVDYASSVYGIPFAYEFVMQPYAEEIVDFLAEEDDLKDVALSEIWHRVINVTFSHMWKIYQHSNDIK